MGVGSVTLARNPGQRSAHRISNWYLAGVQDTFINRVCSSHHVTSPCECGEPLNSVAKDLFEEPAFDPLGIKKTGRVKALSVYFAAIVLSLALAESVSQNGIRFDV